MSMYAKITLETDGKSGDNISVFSFAWQFLPEEEEVSFPFPTEMWNKIFGPFPFSVFLGCCQYICLSMLLEVI